MQDLVSTRIVKADPICLRMVREMPFYVEGFRRGRATLLFSTVCETSFSVGCGREGTTVIGCKSFLHTD